MAAELGRLAQQVQVRVSPLQFSLEGRLAQQATAGRVAATAGRVAAPLQRARAPAVNKVIVLYLNDPGIESQFAKYLKTMNYRFYHVRHFTQFHKMMH